jgi:hypothetical protein
LYEPSYEEHFPAEAADYSYDDVYQVVRKTSRGRPKKSTAEVIDNNTREIMKATPILLHSKTLYHWANKETSEDLRLFLHCLL